MSKIVNCNLLDVKQGIIIHQVNCRGVMGAGVAKAISDKYPSVKSRYLAKVMKNRELQIPMFGDLQFIQVTPDVWIVNCFTQHNYGVSKKTGVKYTDEQKLIDNIRTVCTKYHRNTIYIPYNIGCGLAGGDWNTVYKGIEDLDNLVICKL